MHHNRTRQKVGVGFDMQLYNETATIQTGAGRLSQLPVGLSLGTAAVRLYECFRSLSIVHHNSDNSANSIEGVNSKLMLIYFAQHVADSREIIQNKLVFLRG